MRGSPATQGWPLLRRALALGSAHIAPRGGAELGTTVGYAVTCTADSTTENRPNPRELFPLWEAIEASPKPAVMVIRDIGNQRNRSCHLGEVSWRPPPRPSELSVA